MMNSHGRTGLIRFATLAFLVTFLLATPSVALAIPPDLDCADFGSRELANRELRQTSREYGGDIHGLDRDGDGQACETASSAQIWSVILATVGAGLAVANVPTTRQRNFLGPVAVGALGGGILAWILLLVVPRSTPYWLVGVLVGTGVYLSTVKWLRIARNDRSVSTPKIVESLDNPKLSTSNTTRTAIQSSQNRSVCSCGAWTFPENRDGKTGFRCSRIPECGRWYPS